MRNDAEDPNLSGRNSGRDRRAVPAASTAAATAATADGELPGRIDGSGGRDLSASSATASSATSGAAFRRTRLIFDGRRKSAGRHRFAHHPAIRFGRPISGRSFTGS
jgi:hypothetical protein